PMPASSRHTSTHGVDCSAEQVPIPSVGSRAVCFWPRPCPSRRALPTSRAGSSDAVHVTAGASRQWRCCAIRNTLLRCRLFIRTLQGDPMAPRTLRWLLILLTLTTLVVGCGDDDTKDTDT